MAEKMIWTAAEIEYLKQNRLNLMQVARDLGRSKASVYAKAHSLGVKSGRNWTPEEEEYLCDRWGATSIPWIAKKLGRTENAVLIRAQRLGLGPHLESDHRVPLNQLLVAFDKSGTRGSGYFIGQLERAGCPIKYHRVRNNSFRVIDIDAFWEWAESNKRLFDFARLEPNILGPEPEWVKEKRKADQQSYLLPHNTRWTPRDDNALKAMLGQNKYTYADLSRYFSRSEGAIKRRIHDLALKEKPVRSKARAWQEKEIAILIDMFDRGYSYEQIGAELNRTALQVRGKHENIVHPEWVIDARRKQKEKKQKAKLVSNLVYLLRLRRNGMEFGEYWQKDMCMLWDDLDGCSANEKNCDECVSFIRIRPQYCRRCGDAVMSRKKIDTCDRCKRIKKWQHRKKAAALGNIQNIQKKEENSA